ncbi:MAG TPA: MTH938/NDUFAF3 family protein [Candidatus Glassbacteria bacterium]|nr:MTH938/NDUFAF3 family protein [Candidatus Glassbacteria bacterium]
MKPEINGTSFGSITIEGLNYEHDVVIRLDGKVKKRKKKLSKVVYGTSHVVSQAEAEKFYEKGCEKVIVGCGQYGALRLSEEALKFLESRKCKVEIARTPAAIEAWNSARGKAVGLFHVTC